MLTLTTLSQPHDTMTGFNTLGLNRTHDTLQRTQDQGQDYQVIDFTNHSV